MPSQYLKNNCRFVVKRCCALTFVIGPSRDIIKCDVSHLDCFDLILGITYQRNHNALYSVVAIPIKYSKIKRLMNSPLL